MSPPPSSRPARGATLIGLLVKTAVAAQKNAYCPLTGYPVGAAALGESGRIYPGANVESPTGILHVCADRAAIFNAISHGERRIRAIATACRASVPCGACRQAILEFGTGDTPVYSLIQAPAGGKARLVRTTISKLMPMAHTSDLIYNQASPPKTPAMLRGSPEYNQASPPAASQQRREAAFPRHKARSKTPAVSRGSPEKGRP